MSESGAGLPLDARIYVAGHRGMVGSAILRALKAGGHANLITRTRAQLDLTDGRAVRRFFQSTPIDHVFLAAAKAGGIMANNTARADFIQQNLAIQGNVIHEAQRAGVQRLLFLGSSCIYPRLAPQPIQEEQLLGGPLEFTNQPYAIAKIAGIEMCDAYRRQHGADFRAAMPTNLYGPGDNFDLQTSHVIPALIRKFHEARVTGAAGVTVWGSGKPRREFLHVDDLAQACVFLLALPRRTWDRSVGRPHLNVGYGSDLTIAELARMIGAVTGFRGRIVFDPTKPDGTPRKLLDSTRIGKLGFKPRISLAQGLESTYRWFLARGAGGSG